MATYVLRSLNSGNISLNKFINFKQVGSIIGRPQNNELYIYKMIGDFEKFIPHKLNPVVTDCRIARNAGILKFTNMILRPSQINNSYGYGIGLNINKIISLSIENS